MAFLYVKNQREFFQSLHKQIEAEKADVSRIYRGFCISVFHYLLQATPQRQGDMVANWMIARGSSTSAAYFYKGADPRRTEKTGYYAVGDEPKILEAANRASNVIGRVNIGESVTFVNLAPHAPEVDSRSVRLRPENQDAMTVAEVLAVFRANARPADIVRYKQLGSRPKSAMQSAT